MLGKLNFYYMGIDSWSGEKFKIKLDLSEKDENGNYGMYLYEQIMNLKNEIDNILCEKDIYTLLAKGKSYIEKIAENENLPLDLYFDLTYYCMDFFREGFNLKEDKERFYYNHFFGDKIEYFCNRYMELKGKEVFNNKEDVNFLIETAAFYELADKFDEKFDLLELITDNSSNDELKLRAVEEILNIGDIDISIRDKYEKLRDDIINNSIK